MSVFEGKTAVVTGAASGIGEAVARELGRRGAHVYAADVDEAGVAGTAQRIVSNGGLAEAVILDVTKSMDVEDLLGRAAKERGSLDYVFNNAGVGVGGEAIHMDLDAWNRIIDVNLWGVIYGTTAAYRIMVEQGHGHIVNTASVAGLVALPGQIAYNATKHAVVGLTNTLRAEAEHYGVNVSVVCPGLIDTPIFATADVRGMDIQKILENAPFKAMDAKTAAGIILTGVERNRGIIVVTRHAGFLWRVYRYAPWMFARAVRKSLVDLRAAAVPVKPSAK
ncbi:MAG: SDR family NAD(P)-dependent oxidoreductase [Desulfatibacillaceae bacterium]